MISTVWASLIAQWVKNPPAMQEIPVLFLGWKIRWRRDRLPSPVFLSFPCGSAGKKSVCNVGDLGLIPGLGWSPGEGKGYPLQYSGLENSIDCTVHRVTKNRTWLRDFHLQAPLWMTPHGAVWYLQAAWPFTVALVVTMESRASLRWDVNQRPWGSNYSWPGAEMIIRPRIPIM